ncbi:hypothetical protein MKW98_009724 [Papaver atlanticum]|uniref:Uncharacterized protein n=1 Tax=Papaver atlanticum TaxID=357466 RepID=A0AAD4SXH8_9MAGN|nr:hypothetical protein MKW98_009724 [Papaver atlanticum]
MTKISLLHCFILFVSIVMSASSSDMSLDAERDYAEQHQLYQVVKGRALESPCPIIGGTCSPGTVFKRACGSLLRCPCCVSL